METAGADYSLREKEKRRGARLPWLEDELAMLLATTTAFFALSFLLHYPTLVPSNYSDIVSLYNRKPVSGREVPYVNFGLEYPVLSGLVVYLASLTGNLIAYYTLASLVIYACVLGSVVIIYRLCKHQGLDTTRIVLFCVATPSFLYFSIYSFDWLGVFLTLLSLYTLITAKRVYSAFALGLAASARIIPIIFTPILLLNIKGWRERINYLAWVGLGWLIPNAYFIVANFGGWFYTFSYQFAWGIEDSFLIFLFPQIGQASHYASMAIILYLYYRIVVAKIRGPSNVTESSPYIVLRDVLAVTLAFVIGSYKVPPQYGIMLLPFLALVPVVKLPAFYLADILNVLIILTWFVPSITGGNPLVATSPTQWISAGRQSLWAFFLIQTLYPNKIRALWRALLQPVLRT